MHVKHSLIKCILITMNTLGTVLHVNIEPYNMSSAPQVELCRSFGAHVEVTGADIIESKKHAMTQAKQKGLMYVNGYDHPHILAGQGTMGLEIVEQVRHPGFILLVL